MRVKAKKILTTVAIGIAGCLLVAQFVTIRRTNPPVERRSRGTTANQITYQGSLLRLPFQRNPVALVHLRRSDLMVGRTRCGTRTPRLNFSEWGSYYPTTQKRKLQWMDGALREERAALPPWSYRILHPGAGLTPRDLVALEQWIEAEIAGPTAPRKPENREDSE